MTQPENRTVELLEKAISILANPTKKWPTVKGMYKLLEDLRAEAEKILEKEKRKDIKEPAQPKECDHDFPHDMHYAKCKKCGVHLSSLWLKDMPQLNPQPKREPMRELVPFSEGSFVGRPVSLEGVNTQLVLDALNQLIRERNEGI